MNDLQKLMAVDLDLPETNNESIGLIKLDLRSMGLTFEDLASSYNMLTDRSTFAEAKFN